MVAALALIGAACSGDDGAAPLFGDQGAEETDAVDESDGPADVADILPSVDDLPDGWAAHAPLDGEDDDKDCFDRAFDQLGLGDDDQSGPNSAEATFAQSESGPFLVAGVEVDTAMDLDALFDNLDDAFFGCDGTTDADGFTATVQDGIDAAVGDDTFTVHVRVDGPASGDVDYVIAREGDSIFYVARVSLGRNRDGDLLASVAGLIADRLRSSD